MAAAQLITPSKGVQEALSVAVPGLQVQRASGQLGTGGVDPNSRRQLPQPERGADHLHRRHSGRQQPPDRTASGSTAAATARPGSTTSTRTTSSRSRCSKGRPPRRSTAPKPRTASSRSSPNEAQPAGQRWSTEFRAGANWLPSPEKLYEGIYYKDGAAPVKFLNLVENDIDARIRLAVLDREAGGRHGIGSGRHGRDPLLLQRQLRPGRRNRQLQLAEQAQWHGQSELLRRREVQGRPEHGVYPIEAALGVGNAAHDDLPDLGLPEQFLHGTGLEA